MRARLLRCRELAQPNVDIPDHSRMFWCAVIVDECMHAGG